MLKPYMLTITKTARPMGNNSDWSTYDKIERWFNDFDELKEYLKKEYYYVKTKIKTFRDEVEGQTGWIYSFKSPAYSYDDCKHYERHWINCYQIDSKEILV